VLDRQENHQENSSISKLEMVYGILSPKLNIPFIRFFTLKEVIKNTKAVAWPEKLFFSPIIEIMSITLSLVLIYYLALSSIAGVFLSLLVILLTALAVSDYLAFVLPDNLTYSLLLAGLVSSVFHLGEPFVSLSASITAMAILFLYGFLIHIIGEKVIKQSLFGLGDVKLCAAMGAWFGIIGALWIVLIASLMIIIFHILTQIFKFKLTQESYLQYQKGARFPFGSFIWLSSFIFMFSYKCLI
jgi:leader peptidase (prepilin peptidase)/N-methyltransferase